MRSKNRKYGIHNTKHDTEKKNGARKQCHELGGRNHKRLHLLGSLALGKFLKVYFHRNTNARKRSEFHAIAVEQASRSPVEVRSKP